MDNRISHTDYLEALRKGQPIERCELKWYPITLQRYEEWQKCKPALTLRQSTFPAAYISMPFLAAVYAMEFDLIANGGNPSGLWTSLERILTRALRLSEEEQRDGFHLMVMKENPRTLYGLEIVQDGKTATIYPKDFPSIRQLIADQNAEVLPDEADNPELVEAERFISSVNTISLDYSADDLFHAVALATHIRVKDLMEWTIREFELSRKAIDRAKRFELCAIAEGNGCKWKDGNPYPSWCYERKKENTALIDAEQWESGLNGVVEKRNSISNLPT